MRRRSFNRGSTLRTAMYASGLVIALGGLGWLGASALSTPIPDSAGCYADAVQKNVIVIVDASEPRWNEEQVRGIRARLQQMYADLTFNERLNVYTTENDVVSANPFPRVSVCGQAHDGEELKAIGAPPATRAFLARERERLYKEVIAPQLDAIFTAEADETRLQLYQSPLLEFLAFLSRQRAMPGGRLVVISDLLQNSETARFCAVQNDMPRYATFETLPVYERVRPEKFEGVKVELLMLQRQGYGRVPGLQFCRDEEEIRAFWTDYFNSNGATRVDVTRIRLGFAE